MGIKRALEETERLREEHNQTICSPVVFWQLSMILKALASDEKELKDQDCTCNIARGDLLCPSCNARLIKPDPIRAVYEKYKMFPEFNGKGDCINACGAWAGTIIYDLWQAIVKHCEKS